MSTLKPVLKRKASSQNPDEEGESILPAEILAPSSSSELKVLTSSPQKMSESSVAKPQRVGALTALLTHFLHPDVISLVLSYEVTIQFVPQRSYGGQYGSGDGEMDHPSALVLHADELFVVDKGNHRIQVFHQGTGRFLRKWGQKGVKEGEFRSPLAGAVGWSSSHDQDRQHEIFIRDQDHIHIFRLSDSHFLRRYQLEHLAHRSLCGGIVVNRDHIFVFRTNPTQIDCMTRLDGKRVKCLHLPPISSNNRHRMSLAGKLFLDDVTKSLLLADSRNDRILALDLISGQLLSQYGGGGLHFPRAALTHGEEVIACDTYNHRLVVFDRFSTRALRAISLNAEGILCCYPVDLAVSVRNELFVVCKSTHQQVLVFQ